MALNYTADPTATQAPAPTPAPDALPILHLPTDGEAANVASIYQDFKALADYVGFLTTRTFFSPGGSGYNNVKALHLDGAAGADDAPGWETGRTGSAGYVCLFSATGIGLPVRVYAGNTAGLVIAVNCAWDAANTRWNRDGSTGTGGAIYLSPINGISVYLGLVAAHWTDSDWIRSTFISATGALTLAAGIVSGASLTAKRILGNGSALVSGDFGTPTRWGTSPTVTPSGNDMSGTVAITTGSSPSNAPVFTFTYHDGTYTTAPRIMWALMSSSHSEDPLPLPSWTSTATASVVTMPASFTPNASSTYTFVFQVMGQ